MTGGGNGGTTPMTMAITPPTTDPTPPADTTPPPPAPSFSDINGLTSAQRLPAITTNPANTNDNGVTKSAEMQDSVSAVTDSGGNLMFHVVAGERRAVMVDNSNTDWTGTNAPPLSTFSYIFDKDTGASKTLAEYENGDFYAVTGFWYRSPTDFGVFADGSPPEPLPPSGGANYRGNVGGQYWGDVTGSDDTDAPEIFGNFIGNINLRVSVPGSSSNNTMLSGVINIPAVDDLPNISFVLDGIFDNNGNGVFTGANRIACDVGCGGDATADNLSAQLIGDPVSIPGGANSEGFPAGIIGAFSLQDLPIGNSEIDILGFFGAIHEDLCLATASGGSAAFCTK